MMKRTVMASAIVAAAIAGTASQGSALCFRCEGGMFMPECDVTFEPPAYNSCEFSTYEEFTLCDGVGTCDGEDEQQLAMGATVTPAGTYVTAIAVTAGIVDCSGFLVDASAEQLNTVAEIWHLLI